MSCLWKGAQLGGVRAGCDAHRRCSPHGQPCAMGHARRVLGIRNQAQKSGRSCQSQKAHRGDHSCAETVGCKLVPCRRPSAPSVGGPFGPPSQILRLTKLCGPQRLGISLGWNSANILRLRKGCCTFLGCYIGAAARWSAADSVDSVHAAAMLLSLISAAVDCSPGGSGSCFDSDAFVVSTQRGGRCPACALVAFASLS